MLCLAWKADAGGPEGRSQDGTGLLSGQFGVSSNPAIRDAQIGMLPPAASGSQCRADEQMQSSVLMDLMQVGQLQGPFHRH